MSIIAEPQGWAPESLAGQTLQALRERDDARFLLAGAARVNADLIQERDAALRAVALLRERLRDVLQIERLRPVVDLHDERLFHSERARVTAAQAALDATAEVR